MYRAVNLCFYDISNHHRVHQSALVDRGANGGVAGNDVRVIFKSPTRTVNIRGIDNHQIDSVPIVTAGAVATSQHGCVIILMHQYAYHGKGKTFQLTR